MEVLQNSQVGTTEKGYMASLMLMFSYELPNCSWTSP